MRTGPLLLLLAGAASAGAPAASAASASVARGTVFYEAAPGERNSVTVTRAPGAYRIADAGATIGAGGGCVSVTPILVACEAKGVRRVEVRAGDGDDFVTASVVASTLIRGGDGDDVLEGGEGDDLLRGGAGSDALAGGSGFDLLNGGPGPDSLSGGTGSGDIFEEEPDFELDGVSYVGRAGPVTVTLDGLANDGEAGEGDHVLPDVEGALGGSGDDALLGNDRLNAFAGGPGDDVLRGDGRFDILFGEGGDDRVSGGAGEDVLVGGRGDDALAGGLGGDLLEGGVGDDTATGGPGSDLLAGFPGSDRLRGGSGGDFLVGGRGGDVMAGGTGRDSFSARDRTRDVVAGGRGRDRAIVDRGLDRVFGVEILGARRPLPPAVTGRAVAVERAWRRILRRGS